MPDPSRPESTPSTRGRRSVGWVAVGALVLALLSLWAVATPLMSSPDETSHAVKAAAVARGQWSGELGPPPVGDTTRPGAGTVVQLPADLAASLTLANCYAFQPDVTADCVRDLPPRTEEVVPVETFAGQYPPLYYYLVGQPSRVLSGEPALYAMRLVSALLSTVMITWGAYRLTTTFTNRLATWGVVVALTPMAVFLAGTVNPNGWEITCAFSFWAAGMALVARRSTVRTGALLQAGVSAGLLVNIRESSPLWGLGILLVLLVLAPPGRIREVVRHRASLVVLALGAVASVTAVTWFVSHGEMVSARDQFPRFADPAIALLAISGRSYEYVRQMVGDFGWLDTPAPPVTWAGWYVAGGALLLLAFGASVRARAKVGLALLIAAVLLAPLLQFPTAEDAGLIWQGRYVLPLAIGIPLVAVLLLEEERPDVVAFLRRVLRVALPVVVVAHVAGFYWASRRYSEGVNGDLFTLSPNWSSPVGYLTGVGLYALVCVALAAVVWRSTTGPLPAAASGPAAASAEPDCAVVAADRAVVAADRAVTADRHPDGAADGTDGLAVTGGAGVTGAGATGAGVTGAGATGAGGAPAAVRGTGSADPSPAGAGPATRPAPPAGAQP